VSRRPTRATAGGRAYLDLRKLAQERHRPTAELLQLYALEGFLVRLPSSTYARRFVLKGGVLLAAFDARRPTKDIDLSATGLRNHPETVRAAIQAVLELGVDDGLEFDLSSMEAQAIREGDDYSGVRVTVPCLLASANLDFHIDVNIGDPIHPAPTPVSIPRILGGDPIRVTGYPIAMVLAEKIVTAIQRGTANTRLAAARTGSAGRSRRAGAGGARGARAGRAVPASDSLERREGVLASEHDRGEDRAANDEDQSPSREGAQGGGILLLAEERAREHDDDGDQEEQDEVYAEVVHAATSPASSFGSNQRFSDQP
jgi:hypothetical protein